MALVGVKHTLGVDIGGTKVSAVVCDPEARIGAGRGLTSFMYVSVGTGLSSTFVVNGQTWAGQRGEAIAFGEIPLEGLMSSDSVNLESYSSGAGMAERYREATGADPETAVAILAEQGDDVAYEIAMSSALALGRALSLVARVLDPAAFVLGGGLGASTGLWWTTLAQEFEARSTSRPNPPRLIRAQLGEDSGAVGAALTAVHARLTADGQRA